jgi:hypothetical protein
MIEIESGNVLAIGRAEDGDLVPVRQERKETSFEEMERSQDPVMAEDGSAKGKRMAVGLDDGSEAW